MDTTSPLQLAWRTFWTLKKHREEPLWARMAVSTLLAIVLGAVMMFINGMLTGRVGDPGWWRASLMFNLGSCVIVGYCILALTRLCERLLPEDLIKDISATQDWRAGLVINGISIAGVTLGCMISLTVISWITRWDAWSVFLSAPIAQTEFLAFVVVIAAGNWIWWRQRARQQVLLHQATEAQLRLLQAQIEPHFLFNTLANVHSLMEHDTPRAKQMLETFTDYLRASLLQLRHTDSTLAAELEMARSYLDLLQIRMEERLRFEIDASDAARAAVLPTLLLQPLIENAIEHGLEPKIDGGTVRITAAVRAGRLDISVEDDGLGMDAPRRPGRRGGGIALANVRQRLHTRYGANASLALATSPAGTRVLLNLPYTSEP